MLSSARIRQIATGLLQRQSPRLSRPTGAVAAGAALSLAFPPVDAGWLAPIPIAALVMLLRGVGAWNGARLGFLAGVAFFGLHLLWTSIFGWVAWVALVVGMAIPMGALGAGIAALARIRLPAARVIGIAGIWAAAELMRSRFPLGGYPWGLLGVSQHSVEPARAMAAWVGTVGISALVAAEGALLAEAAQHVGRFRRAIGPLIALVALVALQTAALLTPTGTEEPPLRVAIVQAGVEPGTVPPEDEVPLNEARHVRSTFEIADEELDLIVWGEDVLDLPRDAEPATLSYLSSTVGIPILGGYTRRASDIRFENAVGLFDVSGRERQRYLKLRPVPFGEYVPLRRVFGGFPPLRRQVPLDMLRGRTPVVFRLENGTHVGSLISFESIFSDLARQLVERGAEVLVVNTNNASFRRSAVSRQHLAADQMRAAELGRYVVRAAITGTSAFIDSRGRVTASLPVFARGALRGDVRPSERRTVYARVGEWPVGILAAASVVMTVMHGRGASTRRPRLPGRLRRRS